MQFPVLDLKMVCVVQFFEEDASSVQKISMVDNTRYNPTWYSRYDNPPVTSSLHATITVPFSSEENTSPTIIDFQEFYIQDLMDRFSDSYQTLQLLEQSEASRDLVFYPHTAYIYIRFKESQLKQVLAQQLDIFAYFNPQKEAIYNGSHTEWSKFSSLTKSDSIWNFNASLNATLYNQGFNIIELRKSLSYADNFTESSLNWILGASYVSTFKKSLGFSCTIDNQLMPFPYKFESYALSTSHNELKISSNYSGYDFWVTRANSSFFKIALFNGTDAQMSTVMKVDLSNNVVVLSDKLIHSTPASGKCIINRLYLSLFPIPDGWTCPVSWFGDGECDCWCSSDIDCWLCPDITCAEFPEVNDVVFAIAEASLCDSEIYEPGRPAIQGYFGDESKLPPSVRRCPSSPAGIEPTAYVDGTFSCGLIFNYSILEITKYQYRLFTSNYVPPFQHVGVRISIGSASESTNATFADNILSLSYQSTNRWCTLEHLPQFSGFGILLSGLQMGVHKLYVKITQNDQFFPVLGLPYNIVITNSKNQQVSLPVLSSMCPTNTPGHSGMIQELLIDSTGIRASQFTPVSIVYAIVVNANKGNSSIYPF
jgi:hypothetical protein